MKITTWNVNGIRANLKKGMREWVAGHAPDIYCLQEIKAKPEQIEPELREMPGYLSYWNPAERPGYSGVLTYSRVEPQAVRLGLGVDEFDNEGRVVRLDFGEWMLWNIYFPNGQRGQGRVDYKLAFYAELLRQCDVLHAEGKKLVITGDFNTAHREIDLANPRQNANTSGFLPEERAWVDQFLQHGFVDAFRALYPERVQYTWWTYISGARSRNVGWRLDYFLVSDAVMPAVRDVVIHDDVLGSDHCPVTLDLDWDALQ